MSTQTQNISQEASVEVQIIALLREKDKRAVQLIFENYSTILLNIIVRIVKYDSVAEDVFQEALLKVWKNGPSYDGAKGSLFTWLARICKNAAIDKTRSKDFRLTETSRNAVDLVSIAEAPVQEAEVESALMQETISQLPTAQKELIDLAFFQGYTHKEIAENLDMPLGTVKTRIRSAIKNLRSII